MLTRILIAATLALLVPGASALAEDLPETERTCAGHTLGGTSAQACADPDDAEASVACHNTLLVRFTCAGL